MKLKKVTMMLAAFGMAVAPAAAAQAQASVERAAAPVANPSYLQDDEDDDGGSTAVWLGLLLIVLLAAIAISDGGDPDNTPASP